MRASGLLGLALLSASAAGAGGLEVLEALGRTLQAHDTWAATYHQTYVPAGMSGGEEAEGTVWVAWPDRARFRTELPVPREMALDGRRVRLLDLELGSCDDHVVSEDEWARVPLAAVLDPRGAVDRFTVSSGGQGAVTLVPREPGGVARVELEVGAEGLPAEVVIVDAQGARNRLLFSGWKPSQGPPDGQWLPDPPPGCECGGDLDSSGSSR